MAYFIIFTIKVAFSIILVNIFIINNDNSITAFLVLFMLLTKYVSSLFSRILFPIIKNTNAVKDTSILQGNLIVNNAEVIHPIIEHITIIIL